jgi:tungstate transport system ATP-binding protein
MRAPMSDLPLALQGVTVKAGDAVLLRDVSVSIHKGAPSVILGPNGAGKTTLLRVGMGLLAPARGGVTWGGREQSPNDRRAIVFQRPVMLKRSAAANIAFALGAAGVERKHHAGRIADLLERVGLSASAQSPARRLSGGEAQRLAIARALAREPEMLFLDEPTNNLDPASTRSIERIIADAAGSGIKVVMTTHDLGQARRLAGDVVFLVGGVLVEHGPSEAFFTTPVTTQAAAFLRGDIVDQTPSGPNA